MKPDSTASRQMIRFSLDAEHSAATTKTVLAILEEAVTALHSQWDNGINLVLFRSGWTFSNWTRANQGHICAIEMMA